MLVVKLRYFHVLTAIFFGAATLLPAVAEQKIGMPDLSQEEQTCLPTSTANLIVWFGLHGYPKLIVRGDNARDGYIHTVHALMTATNARYDIGTRTDAITSGIENYIRNAGYSCDVEYRGLDWGMVKRPPIVKDYVADRYKEFYRRPRAFTQDWLQDNANPNQGFILLLAYCAFDRETGAFVDAIHAGHAVTLVNAEPDTLLIHDPAHLEDEPGRKIVTPELLTGGFFQLPGYNAPVNGLLLVSGTMLKSPPGAVVMITGAVCITMHPRGAGSGVIASAAGAPTATIGGGNDGAMPASAPTTGSGTWAGWVFNLLFKP
jgi:hypothetical protein